MSLLPPQGNTAGVEPAGGRLSPVGGGGPRRRPAGHGEGALSIHRPTEGARGFRQGPQSKESRSVQFILKHIR